MTKGKILVCDDERDTAEDWVQEIKKTKEVTRQFDIETMFDNIEQFEDELKILSERQKTIRQGEMYSEKSAFDEADIIIIDFDLVDLEMSTSGEAIAYLVRCFSECKVIIGLNQLKRNIFDLTLRNFPDSFCDININEKQIDNPGLWTWQAAEFKPWYWKPVLWLYDNYQKRYSDVEGNLRANILDFFGLKEDLNIIPKSVATFLGSVPEDSTFLSFVLNSDYGLKRKDAIALQSVSIDESPLKSIIYRVAAARVSKWLEDWVLVGQDVLVDAPHLVERYPSLAGLKEPQPKSWNDFATFSTSKIKSKGFEVIESYEFLPKHWLSKHAWHGKDVATCKDILEVRSPWERNEVNISFCEDTSKFQLREKVEEFSADVHSPFARRFVEFVKREGDNKIFYEPMTRLLSR